MKIKQDPITRLWCREDGAVLMPPSKGRFKTFRWTFGCKLSNGYKAVQRRGKTYLVHQMVCRSFSGLAPIDKPFVDHINRIRSDNRPENLHWVDRKENNNNCSKVLNRADYGVRACEDKKAYMKARCAKMKAQGLSYRKGPNGKQGWYPRVTPAKEVAPCM